MTEDNLSYDPDTETSETAQDTAQAPDEALDDEDLAGKVNGGLRAKVCVLMEIQPDPNHGRLCFFDHGLRFDSTREAIEYADQKAPSGLYIPVWVPTIQPINVERVVTRQARLFNEEEPEK